MSIPWFWRGSVVIKTSFIVYCLFIISIYSATAVANRLKYILRNKNDFKYQIKIELTENSHLTLMCPEIEKESHIQWFKDDEILNSSFRNNIDHGEEPRITIDAYNALYILHATRHEEGVYTCKVDGDCVQQCNITIVSKSKLLNHDFIRFSMYLGFVLSLTLICYCAGICLAWHKKALFADPLNLYKQKTRTVRNI